MSRQILSAFKQQLLQIQLFPTLMILVSPAGNFCAFHMYPSHPLKIAHHSSASSFIKGPAVAFSIAMINTVWNWLLCDLVFRSVVWTHQIFVVKICRPMLKPPLSRIQSQIWQYMNTFLWILVNMNINILWILIILNMRGAFLWKWSILQNIHNILQNSSFFKTIFRNNLNTILQKNLKTIEQNNLNTIKI